MDMDWTTLRQGVTINTSVLKVSLWLLFRAEMKLGDDLPSERNRLGFGCRLLSSARVLGVLTLLAKCMRGGGQVTPVHVDWIAVSMTY